MSLVTIRNTGDKTVTVGDVEIEAGNQVEVDQDLAISQLGSPGGDATELTRVQTIWGFYGGLAPDADWANVAPKLEVYDENGNRMWLLVDDPTGEHAAEEASKPAKSTAKVEKAAKRK